jgi:hypothetical protein
MRQPRYLLRLALMLLAVLPLFVVISAAAWGARPNSPEGWWYRFTSLAILLAVVGPVAASILSLVHSYLAKALGRTPPRSIVLGLALGGALGLVVSLAAPVSGRQTAIGWGALLGALYGLGAAWVDPLDHREG